MSGGEREVMRGALEDWLIDNRWFEAYDLSHAIVASTWLATQIAAAEQRGREEGTALLDAKSVECDSWRLAFDMNDKAAALFEARCDKAETALADLRAKVDAAVLVAEAKCGIQSSPVAQLRALLDGPQ